MLGDDWVAHGVYPPVEKRVKQGDKTRSFQRVRKLGEKNKREVVMQNKNAVKIYRLFTAVKEGCSEQLILKLRLER